MSLFTDLRIGARLGLGFAPLVLAVIGVAAFGGQRLAGMNEALTQLVQQRMVAVERVDQMRANLAVVSSAVRDIALTQDPKRMDEETRSIEQARQANEALFKELQTTAADDAELASRLERATAARGPYLAGVSHLQELGKSGNQYEASMYLAGEMRQRQAAYHAALDALLQHERQAMQALATDTNASLVRARLVLFGIAAAAMLLGVGVAVTVTRSITRPIARAVAVAETVAAGDLRSTIDPPGRDETGQLLAALARMNDSLATMVVQVRGHADQVASASTQIAQGNADLSQRTDDQTRHLQQTTASMTHLGTTVQRNADTAQSANQLAGAARDVAVRGGEIAERVVATMDDISASSRRIADIVGTIDSIAFQTNILALNAAVEAARAGEQGRGFAVVASEVRGLAQRSAEAAREIKALIGTSVEKVEAGSQLVGEAGRTMQDIVEQVRRVSGLIAEISDASSQQSEGLSEVGSAVAQLDQSTQRNATLVGQSAAAAESLKVQADQLAQTVSAFTLGSDTARRLQG